MRVQKDCAALTSRVLVFLFFVCRQGPANEEDQADSEDSETEAAEEQISYLTHLCQSIARTTPLSPCLRDIQAAMPATKKCLLWSPASYCIGLPRDEDGELTAAAHLVLHSQPEIYSGEETRHVKAPPALPHTMSSVHWSDGEAAALFAQLSPEFAKITEELMMRLCKHSASRSGEEQWLDVSHCFTVGHTLSKRETHGLRPVSPFVKEDFDAGLRHHSIDLGAKHYDPLLKFLGGASYILQHMFAPNTVMGGPERNGGFPPDFRRQTEGCQGWQTLPDDEARMIVEAMPAVQDVVFFKGRITETDLDDAHCPQDESGLRRNELGYLHRERAQHFNSQHEVKRRNDLKEAEEDRIRKVLSDKAEAIAAKLKKQKIAAVAKLDREKNKVAKHEDAEKKKAAKEAKAKLKDIKANLKAHAAFCYCAQPDDGELYLKCEGNRTCHLRAWVHPECARRAGDQVTDAMEKGIASFWCSACKPSAALK